MAAPVHLNALKAFEASARHQSFSAAAKELNVTPAAVGQLVRTLEQWLGTPLFHRGSSGKTRLVTTQAAERALPDIQAGFERLALGLERMRETSPSGVLTVTVSPAFAAKWLLPRIERFHAACPDTDVRLDTQLKAVDFLTQRIDIGVRYGAGHWPGLIAEKLMDEDIYPVCSPQLIDTPDRLKNLAELANETLIHDLSMDGQAGFTTWATWLESVGMKDVSTQRGMKINNSAAVLQAAVDGQGVALARSVMARDDLAAGRLIRLFADIQFVSPLAYHVVYRSECASLPRLKAFRDWLFEEART
ncbi:LysR family transcriptional regulator, glycine cleavage system transcriptional activator [Pseudomonas sp. 43mfcvi1.1]|jgi:LysR family glycine cleavage system transcriptional activator|uniref:transcriptional regulator GcvA n=1 Tax=unclassified Pseudomonas TaxID=196821 RepID=UPI000D6D7677|nr:MULTISPECIES: transcriptional regulator GcvA [unclassified Pseudomonas]PWJ39026.1 LysR family glycine cleavage system transcriptional activator [Pseudomonas sp. 43mfcvi1.1]BBH34073.1 LysR family transcriptional regulator [Pseudomonas sp. St290]SSB96290.1 LysR family transcriptional regulator, glycine cleavage system transcriptional activator [Pseudomonas sp. 43mfcvi1.1]